MLVFVYNADSGVVNTLLDSAHKILSPSTYECQLCELTYGVFKENEAWKMFRESLSEDVQFLHRDEFEKQFQESFEYPVLLRKNDGSFEVLLSAEGFKKAGDTQSLIDRCKQVIN